MYEFEWIIPKLFTFRKGGKYGQGKTGYTKEYSDACRCETRNLLCTLLNIYDVQEQVENDLMDHCMQVIGENSRQYYRWSLSTGFGMYTVFDGTCWNHSESVSGESEWSVYDQIQGDFKRRTFQKFPFNYKQCHLIRCRCLYCRRGRGRGGIRLYVISLWMPRGWLG